MSVLRISPDLTMPEDAVTQTFVFFGKRGSGKSNGGVVMAEEMAHIGASWVALDPVGHWWGLKAKGDGSPGLEVLVFGGPHCDIPLEHTAGAVMADVVLDTRARIVLCTVEFSRAQRAQFVTDFCERLLQRELVERLPLHVFLEEADQFAPQRPFPDEARMLAAVDNLERRGRQGGVGVTLITQRSARINKDLTTQAEVLVAFRTLGPQDRDAIDDWIKYHEAGSRRQEVLETLSKLAAGESWIWSPEWLELFARVQWRRRETFDAAETPKLGAKAIKPHLAKVDLDQIRDRMAATIERAKKDDPKELRKEIGRLKRELESKSVPPEKVVERIEVPVITDEQWKRLDDFTRRLEDEAFKIGSALGGALRPGEAGGQIRAAGHRPPVLVGDGPMPRQQIPTLAAPKSPSNGAVTGPQQHILDALARLETIRVPMPAKAQVALFAGASPRSSSFVNNLGALRSAGLIQYPQPGRVSLTHAGAGMTETVVPGGAPTVLELHRQVERLVSGPQWRILEVLILTYPEALAKETVAEKSGASPRSSSFVNNLGALRSLGFIDYPTPGWVVVQPVLMLEDE
jgi:uncharacterized protein